MKQPFATGRCLCGKHSYRVTGPAVWSGYCHCASCRRFTGSVVTNWLGVSDEHLEFDGDPPRVGPVSWLPPSGTLVPPSVTPRLRATEVPPPLPPCRGKTAAWMGSLPLSSP